VLVCDCEKRGGGVSGDVGLNLDMQREKTTYHKMECKKERKKDRKRKKREKEQNEKSKDKIKSKNYIMTFGISSI
jgi:Ni/Co efflux regulator RcnB